ncbi:MAG: hypothetical protein GX422_09580 [Deltaproteobacteria bacterium]|jgi:hypothetical protein|nr:hypothetical protein [Deltaproteobacteria bacterium]
MNDHPFDYLTILAQLAREFQQKSADLESTIQATPADQIFQQLGCLAEHTTDRFRAAQQSIFTLLPVSEDTGKQKALTALTTMCRCFDELRILCQVLLERSAKAVEQP